jgi:hypothetical protein
MAEAANEEKDQPDQVVAVREEGKREWERQLAVFADKTSELVAETVRLLRQALALLRKEALRVWRGLEQVALDASDMLGRLQVRAEAERVWDNLKHFALKAADVLGRLQERGMSSLTASSEGAAVDDTASSESVQEGVKQVESAEGAEQASAKSKERELRETELAPSIFAAPFSEKYLPVFVGCLCLLGILTLNLMLRSRDAAYAKMGVNQAKTAIRTVTSVTHPRRATKGGPLQENEVTTGLVREVLDIVANHPPVIEALGSEVREGRMSMVRDKKGGVVGSMSLQGHKGEHATVECHAVKDAAGSTLSCTSITVRLPGSSSPLSIPMATRE